MKIFLISILIVFSIGVYSQNIFHSYKTELIDSSTSWIRKYETNSKIPIVVTNNLIHIKAEEESYYILPLANKKASANRIWWETVESIGQMPCIVEISYNDPEIIITIKFQVHRVHLKYHIKKD